MTQDKTAARRKAPKRGGGKRTRGAAAARHVEGEATALEVEGTDEVLVLQFSGPDPLPEVDVDAFVAGLITDALRGRKRPTATKRWSFWLATERPHARGCTFWLGVNKTAASVLADPLQERLEAAGCHVVREHVAIASADLRPLLHVDADGVAIPSRAPASVMEAFAPLEPTSRPFRVLLLESWKRDLLSRLMLGDPTKPILAVPYYGGDEQAELVLGRVGLQMFLRQADGSVLAAARPSDTPPAVWTFEFPLDLVPPMLTLLDGDAQELVVAALAQSRPSKLPAGTCVVGVRAVALPVDPDGSRSYAIRSFFAATSGLMAAEF